MRALAISAVVLAILLLFLPLSSLVWMILHPEALESAYMVTYSVMGPFAVIAGFIAHRYALREPSVANVWKFCAAGAGLFLAAIVLWIAFALMVNASDSGHGASLILLMFGNAGILLLAVAWLLFITQRAAA